MGIFGTTAALFSDFSLLLEAVIFGAFLFGWSQAKKKLTLRHRRIMGSALILNILFVGAYMIRSLLKEGGAGFLGPESIRSFVYLPTVIVHGIASILAFILAGAAFYYGKTHTTQKKSPVFKSKEERNKHRIIGLFAISTWGLSFITGLFVYILLYVAY